MVDNDIDSEDIEHAKTLDVISKFCRAAFALVDVRRTPSVHEAMLALLSEIDSALEKAGTAQSNRH